MQQYGTRPRYTGEFHDEEVAVLSRRPAGRFHNMVLIYDAIIFMEWQLCLNIPLFLKITFILTVKSCWVAVLVQKYCRKIC